MIVNSNSGPWPGVVLCGSGEIIRKAANETKRGLKSITIPSGQSQVLPKLLAELPEIIEFLDVFGAKSTVLC